MVQVDVFWSYGLGAGFAFAAHRQLAASVPPADDAGMLGNRYFTAAVLFLALVFAPSGVCLLWAFPSWETMHVGTRDTIPAWLVTLFAITNVTQGMLGFWVTAKLIRAGRAYLGFLQMALGYLFMFFILVHGWDSTGYQRFFSATPGEFAAWSWMNALRFLVSDVGLTLYLMGLVLIPILFWVMTGWLTAAWSSDTPPPRLCMAADILQAVFVGGLGSAIVASLLIRLAGWGIGLALFAAFAYLVMARPGGYLGLLYRRLTGEV